MPLPPHVPSPALPLCGSLRRPTWGAHPRPPLAALGPGINLQESLGTPVQACTAFCLFVSVDEKEVTSSLLSLPLTHFGCGQGRSLFVTIKNHTGAGHPVTGNSPLASIQCPERRTCLRTANRYKGGVRPQAHVSLGSGPRDSQGLKVTEGRQRGA